MNVKKLVIFGTLSVVALASSLVVQQSNLGKISDAQTLNTGVGTCFQRVSQSFTALMTKSLNSNYIKKSFLTTTSDCIAQANELASEQKSTLTKRSQVLLNQFSSDYYWFSQKTLKLTAQLSSADFDISSSNVIGKFTTLDDLKSEFSGEVAKVTTILKQRNFYALLIATSSLLLFSIFFTSFMMGQKRKRKVLNLLDEEARDILDSEVDNDQARRVFTNIFNSLGLENSKRLLAKVDTHTTNSSAPKLKEIPRVDSVNLSSSIHKNLESFGHKIASYGVTINTESVKEFSVTGNDDLINQIVFHALNYAIDFSKEKKLKLSTSLLGGTALLKINIEGHCFNSNELDYLNSSSSLQEHMNLDLMLLKELTADLEGSFAIKNKINAKEKRSNCELEFIFTVPSLRKTNSVKVLKGSKKDILRQMNSEA